MPELSERDAQAILDAALAAGWAARRLKHLQRAQAAPGAVSEAESSD